MYSESLVEKVLYKVNRKLKVARNEPTCHGITICLVIISCLIQKRPFDRRHAQNFIYHATKQ